MSSLGFKRVLNGLTAGCVDAAIGQECLLDFSRGTDSRLPHCFALIWIPRLTVGGTYRGDRTGPGAMLATDKTCHPALVSR